MQTPLRPPPQRTRPLRRARPTRSTPTTAPARPSPAENPSVSAALLGGPPQAPTEPRRTKADDEYTSSRAVQGVTRGSAVRLADESRREGGSVGVPVQARESTVAQEQLDDRAVDRHRVSHDAPPRPPGRGERSPGDQLRAPCSTSAGAGHMGDRRSSFRDDEVLADLTRSRYALRFARSSLIPTSTAMIVVYSQRRRKCPLWTSRTASARAHARRGAPRGRPRRRRSRAIRPG